VAVGGDSAGGNLAAVACQDLRDQGGAAARAAAAHLSRHGLPRRAPLRGPLRRRLLPDPQRDGLVRGPVRRRGRRPVQPAPVAAARGPARAAARARGHRGDGSAARRGRGLRGRAAGGRDAR
jgi:hypothetical protein